MSGKIDDDTRPSHIMADGDEARESARRLIEAGGLLAFRTDTLYGLGADPFNRAAVSRINKLKEREGRKPVLVVIASRQEALRFIEEPSALFDALTGHYWPGPLTVIGRALPSVPEELKAGGASIGLRLPDDEEVRAFVRACGGALTATSANPAGEPPARNAYQAAKYFPHELDLIVDGGEARTDKPSSVIDVSAGSRPRLVREGEVARADLERVLKSFGAELE
jgi:L-threonylcarbamoyladenylate synthase